MTASRVTNTVTIPLDVAVLVNRVFLPTNPNKLRSGTPEVKAAAHAFKSAVLHAERQGGYLPISKLQKTVLQAALERLRISNASHSGTDYMHAHMLTADEAKALREHIIEMDQLLGQYLNEAKAKVGALS
jgi:hypothetical protein